MNCIDDLHLFRPAHNFLRKKPRNITTSSIAGNFLFLGTCLFSFELFRREERVRGEEIDKNNLKRKEGRIRLVLWAMGCWSIVKALRLLSQSGIARTLTLPPRTTVNRHYRSVSEADIPRLIPIRRDGLPMKLNLYLSFRSPRFWSLQSFFSQTCFPVAISFRLSLFFCCGCVRLPSFDLYWMCFACWFQWECLSATVTFALPTNLSLIQL